MKKFIIHNSLWLFFIMAFAIAWIGIVLSFGPGGVRIFSTAQVLSGKFSSQLILIWICMIAAPAISGIFLTAMTKRKHGIQNLFQSMLKWKVNIKWYISAIVIFPALLLLIFISLSFYDGKYSPSSMIIPGLVAGLIGGAFEEIGWTGFAVPRLQLKYGFVKAGLILGVIHSFWHLFPDLLGSVDFYKSLYALHFFLWIIALTGLRFCIMWIYNRTGSLLLAQLTHASFTGSQLILTPASLNNTETILWYLVFVFLLSLLAVVIIKNYVVISKHNIQHSTLNTQFSR